MSEQFPLKIKRQPFKPYFVLEIDRKEIPARVWKLDENFVVAHIDGQGAYTIDIRDVGFFFVEKNAKRYKNAPAPRRVDGSVLTTAMKAAAKALGRHCGDLAAELEFLRDALLPHANKKGEQL